MLDREFRFRGGRSYLHSTSILNDMVALRKEASGGFDFRFDRKTASQVRYQDAMPTERDDLVGSWSDAGGTVYIVQRGAPIVESQPYDEDGLAGRFEIAEGTVRIPAGLEDYTVAEAIVAGFKALLRAGVAGPAARVAFVRMRCGRLPELPLRIVYSRRIGGFYQGDIHDGSGACGQIYFGEWQ